jgi:hypothetical protein
LCELTHYGLAHNFCDTLARRDEHYFDKIRARPNAGSDSGGPVTSIHDRVAFRTEVSEADLTPDRYPRSSFLDFWTAEDGGEVLGAYEGSPSKRGRGVRFAGVAGPLSIEKSMEVGARGVTVRYALRARERAKGAFAVELNIAMPSCDGPGGRFYVDGKASGGLGQPVVVKGCSSLLLADAELGGSIEIVPSVAADVAAEPVLTVSQSEAGFEKIMQAITVRLRWQIVLEPEASMPIVLRLVIARAVSAR